MAGRRMRGRNLLLAGTAGAVGLGLLVAALALTLPRILSRH
ncbi:MAG: hypothetical protein ABFD80_12395 [Acidobacteriota bacterium]